MPSSTERMFKTMSFDKSDQISEDIPVKHRTAEKNSSESVADESVIDDAPQLNPGVKPPVPSMSDLLTKCLKPGKKNDPGIPQ